MPKTLRYCCLLSWLTHYLKSFSWEKEIHYLCQIGKGTHYLCLYKTSIFLMHNNEILYGAATVVLMASLNLRWWKSNPFWCKASLWSNLSILENQNTVMRRPGAFHVIRLDSLFISQRLAKGWRRVNFNSSIDYIIR